MVDIYPNLRRDDKYRVKLSGSHDILFGAQNNYSTSLPTQLAFALNTFFNGISTQIGHHTRHNII